jgi:hypothetical protein
MSEKLTSFISRHCRTGLEHQAVALQAEYRRQRQPHGGKDRPRPHRNNDRVAFDDAAIDLDTRRAAIALSDAGNAAMAQFRALRLGGTHHRGGKLARMNLSGGFGRTQHLRYSYDIR